LTLPKIEIIPRSKILEEIPLSVFDYLPLYNHPNFLQLVAPNRSFYAKITTNNGSLAFFPFTGQNLIIKWRIFQISFCQKFKPFSINGEPNVEHWQVWLNFLKTNTISCQWPTEILPPPEKIELIKYETKINQILNLESDFKILLGNWKSNRKSALNKSKELNVSQLNSLEFIDGVKTSISFHDNKRWKPTENEISILRKISNSEFFKDHIIRYAVLDKNQILNTVLLLKWAGRYHYLFSFSTEKGFRKEALTKFFFQFMNLQANQKMIFDFEGSSIPGIKAFFGSLGGMTEDYKVIKF